MDPTRTYEQWREVFNRELGVVVVDDEGLRRCARDGRSVEAMPRDDAEAYYLWNALIRPESVSLHPRTPLRR